MCVLWLLTGASGGYNCFVVPTPPPTSGWGCNKTICIGSPPLPPPSLTAQCVGKLGDKEHCLWTTGGDGGCSSKEGEPDIIKGGKKGENGGELMVLGKDTDSFGDKIYQCAGCQLEKPLSCGEKVCL